MSSSFDLLRRSGVASLALLNLVLEYSVVCRTRRSTHAKAYIRRARVSSLVYCRPQLPINPKSFTLGKHRFLVVLVFWVETLVNWVWVAPVSVRISSTAISDCVQCRH
jgi:hypothetical protein